MSANEIRFLGIGAQKCGTSWLHHMLSQHPEIAVPQPKEVNFFNLKVNYEKGLDWYLSRFEVSGERQVAGEIGPNYWMTEFDQSEAPGETWAGEVPELVKRDAPNAKLIVMLRDPVDRAMSAYFHFIRAGRINPSQSIEEFYQLYGVLSIGHYKKHLMNWLKHFSEDQILLLIYEEDLQPERKSETLVKVFEHIDVDSAFTPSDQEKRFNKRAEDYALRAMHWPKKIRGLSNRLLPEKLKQSSFWDITVDEDEQQFLREYYRPHNAELAEFLGRSLPWR